MTTPAMVIGLLPAQAQRVRKALGSRYKFRFVRSEHAHRLRSVAPVTVVMLDYIDHSVSERIDRLLKPGDRLLRVRGLDKNVIALLGNESERSV